MWNWKKTLKLLMAGAAVVAIVLFIVHIASLQADSSTLAVELDNCREKNKAMFDLLVSLVSGGNVSIKELSPFLTESETQDIETKAADRIKTSLPFDLTTQFFPSGWMGDGSSDSGYISMRRVPSVIDGEDVVATRIEYRQGPEGWAGVYWQYPDKNWGEEPGRSLFGARAISFFARGEEGGEIVEFKSGGITGSPHADSYGRSLGPVTLFQDWRHYTIDLSKEDLSSVIGAFAWVAAGADNGGHLVFYIAKIQVE